MFDSVYSFLYEIGYSHPLHPPMTHLPIGMVIGAFAFGCAAFLLRRSKFELTARYCIILAFIGLFPTVWLGYMDWQHYYAGGWLLAIKAKLILAGILLILLSVCLVLHLNGRTELNLFLPLYALCFLSVIGLGFFGGQLVYGARAVPEKSASRPVQAGQDLFTDNCSRCHPDGNNVLKPNLAPKNAPQLEDFKTFSVYIRSPKARDGSQTIMPPFSKDKLSDQQAWEIYQYILQVMRKPSAEKK